MLVLPLLAAMLGQIPETGFSKQCRGFFEKLIDVKLESGFLVLKAPAGFPDVSSLRQSAVSAFPDAGRISVRSSRGSTTTNRGGSGEVSIQLGADTESFTFRVTSPGGDESLVIEQQGSNRLTIELRGGRFSLRYEQEPGKCKLQVKAGSDSFTATRKSLAELTQANPAGVHKHLMEALERYLNKPPFVPFAAAPPGKTIVRLRDGAEIFGELHAKEMELVTDYGTLTIPRSDLVQIFFPGSEEWMAPAERESGEATAASGGDSVVVTRRFSPRGRLQIARFSLVTAYGDLEFDATDVLHMAFGPELETAPGAP
ncbi:MAG TPA: hypothetical protein VMT52_00135 [Planctomycetota bacterium]|nr:hypothetical protein [Planctomycetota bacterium]